MTTYRVDYIACPHCETTFAVQTYNSYNTFGMILYTDGFAHGIPDRAPLLACARCQRYFWLADANCIKSVDTDYYLTNPKYPLISTNPSGFIKSYYEQEVDKERWETKEQEKYIRIRAWWAENGKHRNLCPGLWDRSSRVDKRFRVSQKQEDNLLHLMDLLDVSDPSDVIMKAEIHRELGQFDECLKLLNFPFEDQYLQVIDTIKTQAQRKDRKVSVIPRAVKKDVGLSEEQKEALSGELETLDINIPNEARRSAEILRDLGRLDECMRLLAKVRI